MVEGILRAASFGLFPVKPAQHSLDHDRMRQPVGLLGACENQGTADQDFQYAQNGIRWLSGFLGDFC